MYRRFIFWRDGFSGAVVDDRIVAFTRSWEDELACLQRCGITGISLIETHTAVTFNGQLCCPAGFEGYPRA